ncbi:hypothetical protein [Gelidibacter sp.]|uniref:hypothetical protein n=1 Tax=Gelidibacter sp. TaxID=2018083 RepID=UPI002C9F0744|nr:hypothetical protein [Gelidibacter sp.]HUH28443.1 hypothetical protein [Gelidibacter sp.]
MNKLTKFRILSFSGFIIIFLIISTLMNFFFEDLGGAYKAMISGGLTARETLQNTVKTTSYLRAP